MVVRTTIDQTVDTISYPLILWKNYPQIYFYEYGRICSMKRQDSQFFKTFDGRPATVLLSFGPCQK